MDFDYVFPRVLNRRRNLTKTAEVACLILCFAALAASYLSTALPAILLFASGCILLCVGCLFLNRHSRYLQGQLCDAYSWAPAGVYFTGSLYRQSAERSLPGLSRGEFGEGITHLTANPYPDGQALGCNGVIQGESGHPWFALLVSVNGRVNATRIRPAQYGWQEFIQYRC